MKTFDALYTELRSKIAMREETSGTYQAVHGGAEKVAHRLVERAQSVAESCAEGSSADTAEEIAQLIYQVQVLMLTQDLALHDVYEHL